MASVLTKNGSLSGRYRYDVLNSVLQVLPADVAAACASQLTLSATAGVPQSMTISSSYAATFAGIQMNGKFTAVTPFNPTFKTSVATTTFTYVVDGWDHFGDPIQEVGAKTSTTLSGARCWRVFSAIKSIVITRTDAVGGTPTVDCGSDCTTVTDATAANTVWVRPLPFKLASANYIVGTQLVSAGAWTVPGSFAVNQIKAASGGVGTPSAADTPYTVNNPYGWTPNRLAREGLMTVLSNVWTSPTGESPTFRTFWTNQVLDAT